MATKVIPAQQIRTCDCCGVDCTTRGYAKEGHLTLRQHALDYQGSACADATVQLDLCDRCVSRISEAINECAKTLRAEKKP